MADFIDAFAIGDGEEVVLDIDVTKALDGGGDGAIYLRSVGDVEGERLRGVRVFPFKVGDLLDLARGGDDVAAGPEDLFGEAAAEACGTTSDEPDASGMIFSHRF